MKVNDQKEAGKKLMPVKQLCGLPATNQTLEFWFEK